MLFKKIKEFLKKSNTIFWIVYSIRKWRNNAKYRFGQLTIIHSPSTNYGRIIKHCRGGGNKLIIKEGTFFNKTTIRIIGNNNTLIFEKGCGIGSDCSFWLEGNNVIITIGEGTTFTCRCHFNAQEDGSRITVGKDCMFSNNIIVRTSDSHPIYSLKTGERLNPAKNIIIGDHVWVAPGTEIMKGAIIGNNVIIGSQTMVSQSIPDNSLAVGRPARVVKTEVTWKREDIIFHRTN